jgi:MoxR-like ATPase
MDTSTLNAINVDQVARTSARIIAEVEKAVIGKTEVLRKMLAAFLSSGGHILLEDLPGLAKTLIANSFSKALGLDFRRIQFTPDLLPGDITGGYIFEAGKNSFTLRKGPIFTNLLLADEINRASPKTQSALLESMQEYQVTLEGESFKLANPFIVVATQNPIEYEGTFPLPEAQLDRFLIKLSIGYPGLDEELEILERRKQRMEDDIVLDKVVEKDTFLSMRRSVEGVFIHTDVERYIINLIDKTRHHPQVVIGASPRGSLALFKLIRAWAAMEGRSYVLPDDVKLFAVPALRHRIILEPSLWSSRTAEPDIIEEILRSVPVPVITNAER